MDKSRILIVDDDPKLLQDVSEALAKEGYEPWKADDGVQALAMLDSFFFDLVILDVMMPKLTGFEVCVRIREHSQVPIIMLSAIGDENAKIEILQLGADDYVVKPFSMQELIARVQAVMRRVTVREVPNKPTTFTSDGLEVDFNARSVAVDNENIVLTATEFNLMWELVTHSGEVLTHRVLLHSVWGDEYGEEREYLRVFVNRLRHKLKDDPTSPRFIKTVPGVGYQFIA